MRAYERLILALDVPTLDAALELASKVLWNVGWFKIGLELFTSIGPDGVAKIAELGRPIMLDLKLHDIPATVGRTVKVMRKIGVSMATVHTEGGVAMLKEAVNASDGEIDILGVTVLTSLNQQDLSQIWFGAGGGEVSDLVRLRASLAIQAGCTGVVSSPQEAQTLRALLGPSALIVTPGIRPTGKNTEDQKRVTTPRVAIMNGASMIVVGRPIRDAINPAQVASNITFEIADAMG